MAVRSIHHQHIHAGLDQQRHALFRAFAHADRRADAQTSQFVLAGQGMFAGFQDVFHRDESAQFECIVHHQHALDTVLVHQVARFVAVGIFLDHDEPVARRHDVGDGLVEIALETQVAVGHDADDLLALHHRQAGYLVLAGQVEHIAHGHVRRNGNGIFHHAALETLDLGDLCRLFFGGHVLVHDADAALLRQGNRQARLGDGVHRSGQQRNVQGDVAGKLGAQTDIARQDVGMRRKQQYIVEGEGFLSNTHGNLPLQSAHYIKTCAEAVQRLPAALALAAHHVDQILEKDFTPALVIILQRHQQLVHFADRPVRIELHQHLLRIDRQQCPQLVAQLVDLFQHQRQILVGIDLGGDIPVDSWDVVLVYSMKLLSTKKNSLLLFSVTGSPSMKGSTVNSSQ